MLFGAFLLENFTTSLQALGEDQAAWFRVGQTQAGALRCGDAKMQSALSSLCKFLIQHYFFIVCFLAFFFFLVWFCFIFLFAASCDSPPLTLLLLLTLMHVMVAV